jgi:type II secretory pathway pseudopilin PulG
LRGRVLGGLIVTTQRPCRNAFTIVEVLVVVGVIILLMAILLPALLGARRSASMTTSMGHMRQIATWMRLYCSDNREHVLPSQFNHHLDAFPGHPRCNPAFGQWHARGTWADVLWTQNELGLFPEAAGVLLSDYRFDSPDKALYELVGDIEQNVLRATSPNRRNVVDGTGATPFGDGAQEAGLPGYFAANNFFNDDPLSETYNGRFTSTQIRAPS